MKILLGILTVAAVAGLAIAAAAAPRLDGAHIQTSRSTNTRAYVIKVWSDGGAQFILDGGTPVHFSVTKQLAARFFRDVVAARANPGTPGHCMKSASFGTTTTVLWHDYTSVDLQCPPLTPAVAALNADVKEITALVNTHGVLPRRIPLPREPRMTPKPAPTPTQMIQNA